MSNDATVSRFVNVVQQYIELVSTTWSVKDIWYTERQGGAGTAGGEYLRRQLEVGFSANVAVRHLEVL